MAYTVSKLAKLSGVSSRTLHFYDGIGLLKPAYTGENNYRYYEEEQLLILQQILFYRELDMPLAKIQAIIHSTEFDKIEALLSHKEIVERELTRYQQMIRTIENTILHLKRIKKMPVTEFYYGFDSKVQKRHEQILVERGILTQEFLDESNAKTSHWSEKEKNAFIQDLEGIMDALVVSIKSNLPASSTEVQSLIEAHYRWLELTWTPTKDSYLGLINLYQSPDFRVFYERRHPDLLTFIVESMKIFAKRKLN